VLDRQARSLIEAGEAAKPLAGVTFWNVIVAYDQNEAKGDVLYRGKTIRQNVRASQVVRISDGYVLDCGDGLMFSFDDSFVAQLALIDFSNEIQVTAVCHGKRGVVDFRGVSFAQGRDKVALDK